MTNGPNEQFLQWPVNKMISWQNDIKTKCLSNKMIQLRIISQTLANIMTILQND